MIDHIETAEEFWQQLGRDGLVEPTQVLLRLMALEIARRSLAAGLFHDLDAVARAFGVEL